MNKKYLEEFYETNKKVLDDWEQNINSIDDLENYFKNILRSNLQFDFNLDVDTKKLFDINNNPSINIEINNNQILRLEQTETDIARGGVSLLKIDECGNVDRRDLIEEGDFVMLMNYYYFVKDHDIKDEFINREGINKWSDFSYSQNDLDR